MEKISLLSKVRQSAVELGLLCDDTQKDLALGKEIQYKNFFHVTKTKRYCFAIIQPVDQNQLVAYYPQDIQKEYVEALNKFNLHLKISANLHKPLVLLPHDTRFFRTRSQNLIKYIF